MAMLPAERAAFQALQEKVEGLNYLLQQQSVTMKKLEENMPSLLRSLLQLQSLNTMPMIIAQLYAELALISSRPSERLDELLFAMSGPAEVSLTSPETRIIGLEVTKVHDLIRRLSEEYITSRLASNDLL